MFSSHRFHCLRSKERDIIRKPDWLKAPLGCGEHFGDVKRTLNKLDLHTVCQEAACPNTGTCWSRGTATFMILGDICTRNCLFCNVTTGLPAGSDQTEPQRIAAAVKALSLSYCVITSVTRDDLHDGGAGLFAETIKAIRERCPGTRIEVLVPDFEGSDEALKILVNASPDVIGYNLETVSRLTPAVRDRRTSYHRSLSLLKQIKKIDPSACTKSGLMLGLGETRDEVLAALEDLRGAGCDIVTLGQYLQPSRGCVRVVEYVHPEVFESYRTMAEEMGFQSVASGPLVRSSFMADFYFQNNPSTGSDSHEREKNGGRP